MHFSFLFIQNIYRIDSSVNWKYMVPLNHSSINCLEFLCASLVRGMVGCSVGWLKEKREVTHPLDFEKNKFGC